MRKTEIYFNRVIAPNLPNSDHCIFNGNMPMHGFGLMFDTQYLRKNAR